MPASMATKLGLQFARFAQYTAASNNTGTHGIRSAFANATNGPASAWTPGLNSGGAASSASTGVGGAKFQAGKGAHSSFQHTGRALTNANASSATDGTSAMTDEDDEVNLHSISRGLQRTRRHSPGLQGHGLRSALQPRLIDTSSTLHLIMPNLSNARTISTVRTAALPSKQLELDPSIHKEVITQRHRSLSTSSIHNRELANAHQPSEEGDSQDSMLGLSAARDDAHIGKESSAHDPTLTALYDSTVNAIKSGNVATLWSNIDSFIDLPKEKKSSPGFNIAMDAIWRTRDTKAADNVLKLYNEMLLVDCAPNNVTYAHVVRALCVKDIEHSSQWEAQRKESFKLRTEAPSRIEDNYHKALSILDLVHTSSNGFYSATPYDAILYSCAIRGDAETACLVIERLSANKNVTPTATSFSNFMKSFAADSITHPGESREDFIARRLKACEHVMDEFEVFRQSKDWSSHASMDVKVWNTMISQYILSGHTEKAMDLIEKMVTGKPLKDGTFPAPPFGSRTAQIVIRDLLAVGDIEGATKWFYRVMNEQSNLGTDGVSLMPMPRPITVAYLFKQLMDSLPTKSGKDTQEQFSDSLLPHIENIKAANRICETIFKEELYIVGKKEAVSISDGSWRQLLNLNSASCQLLLKLDRITDANEIANYSLIHISRHVNLYRIRLSSISTKESQEEQDGQDPVSRNVDCIVKSVESLSLLGRSADAASCFTYAVGIAPFIGAKVVYPVPLDLLQRAALTVLQFEKVEGGYRYTGRAEDAKQHISLLLTIMRPSVSEISALATTFDDLIYQLFMTAQGLEGVGVVKELEGRERNALLNSILIGAKRDSSKVDSVRTLLEIFAQLPQEERDLINLQSASHKLPNLFGQEKALELLKAVSETISLSNSNRISISHALVEPEKENVSASESSIASTETAPTSIAGAATPPVMDEYVNSGYELPTLQTIDVDFGQILLQKIPNNATRRNRNAAKVDGVDEAYQMLKKSVEESGTYPSPDALVALIDQNGRRGNLERVKELYAMASNVVASLGGDPQWQMDAWYSLENIMTAALAHGGEPKLASEHRHRLLNAGRAPSADTYGALITVIRDTTDEALVAEELFDESQRLGVRPTRYLYNTVLSKLSRARKLERAMQLFDEMRSRGIQPSSITYGAVLNACTRTGDIVNAERFFAMMESDVNFKPMAPPYNTMMQLYVQTRPDRERALHYYDKLVKMRVQPTTHTYKLLLDLYGSIEPIDLEAMRTIFGQLIADPQNEVQGNHWASLITAYGIHSKDLNTAIEVYNSIPQHVATVKAGKKGSPPDSLSFEALLTVFAEHQRIDLIEKYVEKRKKNGSEMTAYIANGLIKAYSTLVRDDGLDKARAVFEEMEDPPMGMAAEGNHPIQRQHVSGIQAEVDTSSVEEMTKVNGFKPGFHTVKREPSTFEAMIRAEMEHQNREQAEALVSRMQHRGYPPIVVARAQDIVVQHLQTAL